jgi:SAM-dependent methyltransferase
MGRRGVEVDESERWIFNRLAGDYRARPAYPSALVDRLAALAGGAGTAVDLGAGTGLLALPLAGRGVAVRAVEPASAMLDVLREGAGGLAVDPIHAAAEETGLPDGVASLVLLADALHWVEPEAAGREAGRLLAPGGAVAVVEVRIRGSAFADGLTDLIARENAKARPRPRGRLDQFLSAAGVRGRAAETYRDEQVLPLDRLDAVLRSLSLVGPALGPERLEALLASARELASRAGGATWTRELRLTWARRS